MTDFDQRGGGVSANPKNPYQKKLRWSKKGEGGGLNFLTKSKKKTVFFMPPLSIVGKKRDHRILDPLFFSGKIRKNRKNSEK